MYFCTYLYLHSFLYQFPALYRRLDVEHAKKRKFFSAIFVTVKAARK